MACCMGPAADLPLYSDDEIKAIENLPCVAMPKIDFKKGNGLETVYVAQYENGLELTLLFADEDRPNACMDCIYDTIRRPLFGRFSDIETVFIVKEGDEYAMEFPGTYAGSQEWNEKAPLHEIKSVSLSNFELKQTKDNNKEMPVIWCNTWNHLLGEANNNTSMDMAYCAPLDLAEIEEGGDDKLEEVLYECRKGTRAEVDGRFSGLITSVSKVMTPARAAKLGKRLS